MSAATMASRPRPRPAHIVGPTRCAYTPNGQQLVTVGANNTIRLYKTGFDGEPTNVDECQEQNVGVAATDDFFVVGSEDGTVSLYSLENASFERFLVRTSLPVRDVALSTDGRWCAVASDELTVRVVGIEDNLVVRHLQAHNRPTKHVAFDPQGRTVTLACTDGIIYVYSLTADADGRNGNGKLGDPELIRKLDDIIGSLESDAEASAHMAWHPDGRAFAVATATRDIQVISRNDWERQRVFSGGHEGEITALAWSPNGTLLASAGRDGKIVLWETRTQSIIARHDYAGVQDIAWHPTNNLVSFTNGEGEVYICPDFVGPQHAVLLRLPVQPSPFIHDPDAENGRANGRKAVSNGAGRKGLQNGHGLLDVDAAVDSGEEEGLMSGLEGGSLAGGDGGLLDDDDDDDGFGLDGDDEDDDGFVVDDDGAGYTAAAAAATAGMGRKRPHDGDPYDLQRSAKRLGGNIGAKGRRAGAGGASWPARYHAAFQPGSTPWRGNRKYLCLNLVGVVWTVDQDAHHTVTVEFYDRDFQRDYHFTDTFLYDKACLNEHGTLFSCPPREDSSSSSSSSPAMIFYRPHESWTQQRLDWRTALPAGETVVAMSLSASYVTVATSADYVRVYTLFGVPCRVFRPKSTPMVTCASWRDYVLTMGNGPAAPDGTARLQYTIQDVQRDRICQNEDTVALPAGATVQSVFFSDEGDPCIYDSTGTLLTLLHWRQPSRASWVPLLDTRLLPRLASGRKNESYFPIAVADRRFHCIILKGGDKYPYFPRPLLSEFPFSVPLTSVPAAEGKKKKRGGGGTGDGDYDNNLDDDDDNNNDHENNAERTEEADSRRLEQTLVLQSLHSAQMGSSSSTSSSALARLHLEADKTLLQLLALECRAGEERGMRALDLVRLMRDSNGHLMEAAVKVAERYGRSVLGSKIREEAERRLERQAELEDDDE